MHHFGLLGMFCYAVYLLILFFLIMLFLGKLFLAIWPWLLLIGIAFVMYKAVRRNRQA